MVILVIDYPLLSLEALPMELLEERLVLFLDMEFLGQGHLSQLPCDLILLQLLEKPLRGQNLDCGQLLGLPLKGNILCWHVATLILVSL